MGQILQSVGIGQPNRRADVKMVQVLINRQIFMLMPLRALLDDGFCGSATITAIQAFQLRTPTLPFPDGIVSPAGTTWLALQRAASVFAPGPKTSPPPISPRLTDQDFIDAATALDPTISPALLHAFADVESGGRSGVGSSGKIIIAYEGHIFRRLTKHIYDRPYPLLSYPFVKKAGSEWQKNNKDQDTAWRTLDAAKALDEDAAVQACSWGMFQIMGFNYKACDYDDVDSFVDAMQLSPRGQLDAFAGYCRKKSGMTAAMKNKDFQTMASHYNGTDYGDYDKRIARAYKRHGGT